MNDEQPYIDRWPMFEEAHSHQHLDSTLRRVRAEFQRTGAVECLTDGETFHVPAHCPDRSAKAAACAALRDNSPRRGRR
jgi:hypothetical protein